MKLFWSENCQFRNSFESIQSSKQFRKHPKLGAFIELEEKQKFVFGEDEINPSQLEARLMESFKTKD